MYFLQLTDSNSFVSSSERKKRYAQRSTGQPHSLSGYANNVGVSFFLKKMQKSCHHADNIRRIFCPVFF